MSALTATLRGRAAAERDMIDTCTITRLTGSVADPDTGVLTPTNTVVYDGKCKVQLETTASNPTTVGEAAVFVTQTKVHLPMSATGLRPDDVVTMNTCVLDPELVGQVFRLRGPWNESFTTARRLPMVRVSG